MVGTGGVPSHCRRCELARGAATVRYSHGEIPSGRTDTLGPSVTALTTGLVMGWFAQSQWSDANRLVGAALFLVILWPLAIVWSSADPRLWRPLLACVTLILGGCALIYRVGG